MVKHTQTVRRQQPMNCLSVFDHFVGLALKGLNTPQKMKSSIKDFFRKCDQILSFFFLGKKFIVMHYNEIKNHSYTESFKGFRLDLYGFNLYCP